MSTPQLSDEQAEYILKFTVTNEIHATEINDDQFDITLKNMELGALYLLGQMQDKMVRLQDSSRGFKQIGLLHISNINEIEDPDFSNPDDWERGDLSSISINFLSASTWGISSSTYSSVFQIKEISRLKEQM